MSPAQPRAVPHSASSDTTMAVNDFMLKLEHPFKREIETIRKLILGAHPSIAEGIKWKAPSFRTSEYFATLNLRAKGGIGVILHLGAKVRDTAVTGIALQDPDHLLEWLAQDRAAITFTSSEDLAAKAPAFTQVIRQWIAHV